MEDLEYDVEKKYKPRKLEWLVEKGVKLFFLGVGVSISVLLYNNCLFNPNCNTIVTIYFALLGLACFLHAGVSVDKLANVKLT